MYLTETAWEVLDPVSGAWRDLVLDVHPDACDECKRGVWVGYRHPECTTMVPAPGGTRY